MGRAGALGRALVLALALAGAVGTGADADGGGITVDSGLGGDGTGTAVMAGVAATAGGAALGAVALDAKYLIAPPAPITTLRAIPLTNSHGDRRFSTAVVPQEAAVPAAAGIAAAGVTGTVAVSS